MRKFLATALLALWPTLAPAQAPSPVPSLPDAPRLTQYTIATSTCNCPVNFAIYGDGQDVDNWLQVFIGTTAVLSTDPVFGWTLTSASGPLANIARPITNAVLVFNQNQSGAISILGARRPRRISQFQENRGVPARDLNQVVTDNIAMLREDWDRGLRTIRGQPGEVLGLLPPAATRTGNFLTFDGSGNPLLATLPSTTGSLTASFGGCAIGSPPTQTLPILSEVGVCGSYADSGSGAIFQISSWADNTGTRPTVAVFGQGRALGISSRAWGGNFVGYTGNTGAFAQATEIDFGVSNGISSQQAWGLALNAGGTTGAPGANTVLGINFDSLGTGGVMTNAIRFNNAGLAQPYQNGLIVTGNSGGSINVPFGIDFNNLTCTTFCIRTPGFTVDGSGTLNAVNVFAQNLKVTAAFITQTPTTLTGTSGTLNSTSQIINASGAFTLTLPSASALSGQWLYIRSIAAQTITSASSNVVPRTGGAAGTALLASGAGNWTALQSDGTNWQSMMGTP